MRAGRIVGFVLALVWILCACAMYRGEGVTRIALLAPFEGRYREVGYNALYAARLALKEDGAENIELLPVDDGGTAASAALRARALSLDPDVTIGIVLGHAASRADVQQAFASVAVLVVGDWTTQPAGDRVFILASPAISDLLTAPRAVDVTEAARLDEPLVGGEIFALSQFPKLRDSLEGITIVSSAVLPDADFRARYMASDPFAPEPGLLATLTYDAVLLAVRATGQGDRSRDNVYNAVSDMTYDGLNGTIRFQDGYWDHAPVHYFAYNSDRQLVQVPSTEC